LKNSGHSPLIINTGNIVPGPILDSVGHNMTPIKHIEYATRANNIITLGVGAEKEISYKASYFSNYDLKKGQPYYVHGFYITSQNTKGDSKWPTIKFYVCD
jgi:hypothetical protein